MDVRSLMTSLRDVDSPVLLERFGELVRRDHAVKAALLCYIAEIDRRQLWAEQGHSSMFSFCVERFHMSESMAGRRIHAARTMVRFPLVGEMVARSELHLSAVCALAAHLSEENHEQVLARARHLSERQIKKLVVELKPKPDARSRVSREPQTRGAAAGPKKGGSSTGSLFDGAEASSNGDASDPASESARRRSRVEPTAPQRYRVGMTIDEATHDKLGEAQALLSHRVRSGDVAVVFDLALDALLDKLRKERTAATSRPRRGNGTKSKSGRRTRHVPAHIQRAVWERDGNRCAYVSPDGHRCTERRWLELHHLEPWARGGEHTVDGIELRCRPHNQHAANRDYGRALMDRKRRGSQARETLVAYARCA